MRVSKEEAAVLIANWPEENLSLKQRLTLLRQLSSLDLPMEDIKKWQQATNCS